jgi:hypothetical protein
MEKKKLQKLHKDVFLMMESMRAKVPGFYYGMRVKKDKRLIDGYIFHGNENYVSVPLSLKGNSKSKTSAVWLCFSEDVNGNLTSSLKIYPVEMISRSERKSLNLLYKLFPVKNREKTKEERYEVVIPQKEADVIKSTTNFLETYLGDIYNALHAGGRTMVYGCDYFLQTAKNHIVNGTIKLTLS